MIGVFIKNGLEKCLDFLELTPEENKALVMRYSEEQRDGLGVYKCRVP